MGVAVKVDVGRGVLPGLVVAVRVGVRVGVGDCWGTLPALVGEAATGASAVACAVGDTIKVPTRVGVIFCTARLAEGAFTVAEATALANGCTDPSSSFGETARATLGCTNASSSSGSSTCALDSTLRDAINARAAIPESAALEKPMHMQSRRRTAKAISLMACRLRGGGYGLYMATPSVALQSGQGVTTPRPQQFPDR